MSMLRPFYIIVFSLLNYHFTHNEVTIEGVGRAFVRFDPDQNLHPDQFEEPPTLLLSWRLNDKSS